MPEIYSLAELENPLTYQIDPELSRFVGHLAWELSADFGMTVSELRERLQAGDFPDVVFERWEIHCLQADEEEEKAEKRHKRARKACLTREGRKIREMLDLPLPKPAQPDVPRLKVNPKQLVRQVFRELEDGKRQEKEREAEERLSALKPQAERGVSPTLEDLRFLQERGNPRQLSRFEALCRLATQVQAELELQRLLEEARLAARKQVEEDRNLPPLLSKHLYPLVRSPRLHVPCEVHGQAVTYTGYSQGFRLSRSDLARLTPEEAPQDLSGLIGQMVRFAYYPKKDKS